VTKPLLLRLRRVVCALIDHDWERQAHVDICKRCGQVFVHPITP